jgi:hypothetical protein
MQFATKRRAGSDVGPARRTDERATAATDASSDATHHQCDAICSSRRLRLRRSLLRAAGARYGTVQRRRVARAFGRCARGLATCSRRLFVTFSLLLLLWLLLLRSMTFFCLFVCFDRYAIRQFCDNLDESHSEEFAPQIVPPLVEMLQHPEADFSIKVCCFSIFFVL